MPEKLILCSMLRDESENVERFLRSWEGLWSHFIIGFDNATTDNTESIVRQWMAGREDQGMFYHFTWEKDFSKARNTYLDFAYQQYPDCGWVAIGDGDDVLDPRSRDFIQDWLEHPEAGYRCLNCFVYLDEEDISGIPFLMYPRATILANSPDIRFINAAHNVIQCPVDAQLLVQQLIVHHTQAPKKRAYRESQRVAENLPNLMRQAEAQPDDARALFYAANTALDSGDYQRAEALYHQYLAKSTWPNERYQAYLHLAAIRFTAGDHADARANIWAALREPEQWNRAEAYCHLADCALAEGQMVEALHWYGIAGEMPPPISSMFLQGAIYTYLPHWRLALLFDRLGQPEQAYHHAKRAYAWRPAPDFEAALKALEVTLQARASSNGNGAETSVHAFANGVEMATKILPLPAAEMDRLLAEIPVPHRHGDTPAPTRMLMASEGMHGI